MNFISKTISILAFILLFNNYVQGQDTIRLKTKPHVVLKSWYPEFKESPKLKIGESKILFTIIPAFEDMLIRDNDINLIVKDDSIHVKETGKINQYLIKLGNTHASFAEFEIWFDVGSFSILLMENAQWTDIRKIYPLKDNRVMLQKIKLSIEK